MDIDGLLAEVKAQGERMLLRGGGWGQGGGLGGGEGTGGEDEINRMIIDIDNEFSEIDNLLKDVETLTSQ